MAAAYYLSRKHEVSLFERESRLGGHTHTIVVDSSDGPLPVDTGFIVHNDRTYPNLIRLFSELGIETQPSDMSFSVSCQRSGLEYSSRGLRGFFAQRSNAVNPRHYRLLREILRFNREATRFLADPATESMTLGDILEAGHFTDDFAEHYLYPMACAVWSMSVEAMRAFPAFTLLRFFENHGMLGINTHPKWRVLRGGSHQYVEPLTRPYRDRIYSGVDIVSVLRDIDRVRIQFRDRPEQSFDHCVFACHGDQVLPMLGDASESEREVLSAFTTSVNETVLHRDRALLPVRPWARASWNYLLGLSANGGATLTYHMNRLQSLRVPEDYCVTLNANGSIDPKHVIRRLQYRHPIYDLKAIRAQQSWKEISGVNRTHYCGAYWFYGFHEDGLNSALRVARELSVSC